MQFIVDGYNLLHAMGLLGGPVGPNQLAKARAALLGAMTSVHTVDPAILVYDARRAPADAPADEVHGLVTVEYVTGAEADDRIEWLIAHDSAPKRLVVVSDDQRLRQAAKRRGCSDWKCDDYIRWLEKKHKRPKAKPGEKPAGVGPMETDRWLAAFGNLDHDPAWDELFGPFDDAAGSDMEK